MPAPCRRLRRSHAPRKHGMNYLVGDVQGCCDALERLLAEIGFSPSRDRLYVLGDLVNRGPHRSARCAGCAASATPRPACSATTTCTCSPSPHGVRPRHRSDTLDDILDAPDREAWLDWLRQRRMAVHEQGWLMLHAGVVPQWDLALTLALAAEVERQLRERPPRELPGGDVRQRAGALERRRSTGDDRLRFTVNALTRIRFVAADGTLEFRTKDGADAAPPGFFPWFDAPGRRTAGVPIAFGHWSTLGLVERGDLLGLDTGCVWGGGSPPCASTAVGAS